MREKLKMLDLRLTELANYLNISRPTLYKYLEEYEKKAYKNIDFKILDIFKYINLKSTSSKVQVINYIINNHKYTYLDCEKINKYITSAKKAELLYKIVSIFDKDDYEEKINKIVKDKEDH